MFTHNGLAVLLWKEMAKWNLCLWVLRKPLAVIDFHDYPLGSKPTLRNIASNSAGVHSIEFVASREDTLHAIAKERFFDAQPEDLEHYLGRDSTPVEPRWYVFIMGAYQDALSRGYLQKRKLPNCWVISGDGRRELDRRIAAFQAGRADVRLCYLWKTKFKLLIDPSYCPSDRDAQRPGAFYRDNAPSWLCEDIRRQSIVARL
jgi:hypothetical protein